MIFDWISRFVPVINGTNTRYGFVDGPKLKGNPHYPAHFLGKIQSLVCPKLIA